jgi:hypothetical protein
VVLDFICGTSRGWWTNELSDWEQSDACKLIAQAIADQPLTEADFREMQENSANGLGGRTRPLRSFDTTPSSAAAEPEHKPCPGCGAETDGDFWRWKCGSQDPGPKLGGFRQSDECRRAAAERWPPKQFDAQAIIQLQTFRIRELEQQLATAARDLTWQREMRDKAIAGLGETIIRTDKERKEAADRLAEVTRERDALTEELKSAKHYGDHQRAARLEAEAELSALKTEIGDPDDVEPDVIE